MSGRHGELNGADAIPTEWVDPQDMSCDMCGRTIYDGSLRPEVHAGSTLWKCGGCRERDRQRWEAA